jgi:hypothetical protein
VLALKPKTIVELGSHSGNSLFCFAQACAEHHSQARIHAVDTWQGDVHAGDYGEEVYAAVQSHAEEHYPGVITLHRTTFDQASAEFASGSVDLLHIDGLHTYEAVQHDFQTWRSRCSENAVVLFHDTTVYRDDFGVHRFWKEISASHQHFEFCHSNGLGVLTLGRHLPQLVVEFFQAAADPKVAEMIQRFFSSAGSLMTREVSLSHALAGYSTNYHAERHLRFLAEQKIHDLQTSNSWRLTAPLRRLRALMGRR